MGKVCKNLVFLLFTGASFASNSVSSISNVDNSLYALLDKNSSTEAGTVCLDEASCRGDDSSLSKLTESLPKCPKFIIEQQIIRDSRSSLATESPDEICLKNNQALSSHFKTSSELESYLKRNPHFSDLNTASSFSSCLSQGISVPLGLGNSSLAESIRSFPESKKKLAVAEYYSSLKRLQDGVTRSLNNITAIDLMIGKKPLLGGVSCNSFDPLSSSIKEQCSSIKQCSSKVSSASPVSSSLQSSAKDTLLALKATEAIDREIKRLKGPRARNLRKNKEKIEELRERQKSIQSFYPWIEGEVFQDSYNRNDYSNYAESSEQNKKTLEAKMAGLIKRQLTHTRSKLKERKEDFIKASACIRGKEEHCQDLNIAKVLAQTPAINNDEVFKRERRQELKKKLDEGNINPEERREYRHLLTEVSEADSLFKSVDCLQTQRREVKEVNKELALGALDVGIVIGTMGLGTAAVAGKLALRVGGALSKTEKLTKARRLQNLGIFGADASLSAPYMREAMNICEDSLNQLEETAADTNKGCEKLSQGVKHTSDLKSCLLSASLASLPITLPIIGLSGIALVKKLRGTKASPQAVPSSSADRAEEVLGIKLSPLQKSAATRKLEEDLQAIRNSPQEPLLKTKGFKRSYYAGVDQAREFNAVAEYLRKIKADPKRTHIPYFADQIEKTISDFEVSFRKHNQDNPEFLAERLKILETVKKEAQQRKTDQNVTYDWWANFNLRLPLITTKAEFITQMGRPDNLKIHEKTQEILLSATAVDTVRNIPYSGELFFYYKEIFPKEIMFFTTDELGIMAFNKLEDNSYFVGVSGSTVAADGIKYPPLDFFNHDIVHIGAAREQARIGNRGIPKNIIERVHNISRKSDREKAEMALFIARHENGSRYLDWSLIEDYIEKEKKSLLAPWEIKQTRYKIKRSVKDMILSEIAGVYRLSDPDSLQRMLPRGLDINNKEEVQKFLNESADVFVDALLAR